MNLSKLYALLNAVPIVAGGAKAVMDAMLQKKYDLSGGYFRPD